MTTFATHDSVTGRPIVNVPAFAGKDPDDPARLNVPIAQVGGVFAPDLIRIQDLRKAYEDLANAGVKIPAEVDRAFEVLTAVQGYSHNVPTPRIDDMGPDDAVAALDAFVNARIIDAGHFRETNERVVDQCRGMVVSQAQTALERAFLGAVDSVLGQLAKRFDAAAKAFLAEADVVTGYASAGAAAGADETGATVGRWYRGRSAAVEMNAIADLILGMARTSSKIRSIDDGFSGRIPCLIADYDGADDILAIGHAGDNVTRGVINADTPLGMYPAVLAAGGTLSLPASSEEWQDRIETYASLRDAAAMNWFRGSDPS